MLIIIQINVSLHLIYNFLFRALYVFWFLFCLKSFWHPRGFIHKKNKSTKTCKKTYTEIFNYGFSRMKHCLLLFLEQFPHSFLFFNCTYLKNQSPKHYVSCLSIYNNGCYKWNNIFQMGSYSFFPLFSII